MKFGATGLFPDGKMHPGDEGGLAMGVTHDSKGNVHINFGKDISWLAMPADQAVELGKMLIAHAGAKRIEVWL